MPPHEENSLFVFSPLVIIQTFPSSSVTVYLYLAKPVVRPFSHLCDLLSNYERALNLTSERCDRPDCKKVSILLNCFVGFQCSVVLRVAKSMPACQTRGTLTCTLTSDLLLLTLPNDSNVSVFFYL